MKKTTNANESCRHISVQKLSSATTMLHREVLRTATYGAKVVKGQRLMFPHLMQFGIRLTSDGDMRTPDELQNPGYTRRLLRAVG